MSGPTPAKRRRIEATTTLTKPFRSPLKTPTSGPKSNKPIDRSTPIKKSLLSNTTNQTTLPPLNATEKNDPVLLAADAALKDLTTSIATIKAQIELLSQATSILNRSGPPSSQSQHLSTEKASSSGPVASLTQKWRTISQSAADTLYPTVQAKIAAAGGLKAFYAQSKSSSYNTTADGKGFEEGEDWESADLMLEREAESEFDGEGNRVGEAEREMKRGEIRRVREWRKQMEKGVDGKEEVDRKEDDGEEEEEEFSMEVMLRSLHIDEKVIGWDRVEQRWV
ncbi:hypothetical protein MBLNU457_2131t1 [Dothideomycetes sp. NU457]